MIKRLMVDHKIDESEKAIGGDYDGVIPA